jgi:signal transduction histidine kinase
VSAVSQRLSSIGLRWRVAGMSTAVVLVCLGVAFAAVYRGTGSQLRRQTDAQLASSARSFAEELRSKHPDSAHDLAKAADRYVRSRPFSSNSTLLFVRLNGAVTATNRPELFHADVPDEGETAAAQAQENRLAARTVAARPGYSTLPLPDVGNLRLLERPLTLELDDRPTDVTIGVGQPLGPVTHAQEGVARAFVLAALLAGLCALLGGYLIGSRASRPLRRMAGVAQRVDAGDLHPRIEAQGRAAGEVRVLAHAFNHMLDRLMDAFARQREFVADASHELRTPLTVIRGQIEVLAENPNPSAEQVRRVQKRLQAEVVRVDRLIDDLLLLAELEDTELIRKQPVDLESFVADLWEATTPLDERAFALGEIPPGTLVADPDRLAQALRNLLTNAIKQTASPHGRVQMHVQQRAGRRLAFIVDDDGPGIPPDQRERIFDRFHRTDPARDRKSGGAGLGLAIVKAIAIAHGGTVCATQSAIGGARLELELPGFDAASPPAAATAQHKEISGPAPAGARR